MKAIKKSKKTGYAVHEKPVVNHLHELDLTATYSYANYLKWQFDDRLELIRGKIFPMSAATVTHQRLLLRLAVIFNGVCSVRTGCETFIAPFDVRLPGEDKDDNEVYTVVQPDLCVVCDPSRLDEKGCIGRPDLVVEILSPSSRRHDKVLKHKLYAEVGVTEYLIIDPSRKIVLQHLLDEKEMYVQQVFTGGEVYRSVVD